MIHVPLSPVSQRLAAAVSFFDAFRETPGEPPFVREPLRVSIPSHDWAAIGIDNDGIYRFAYPRGVELGGLFDVEVVSESGTYVDFEPLQLALPLPVSSPPLRTDFWVFHKLWPTRSFTLPPGETAVVGRITSPTAQQVARLKVQLHPGSPARRSRRAVHLHGRATASSCSDFPSLPGPVPGGTQTLHISVVDSMANPVATIPASVSARARASAVLRVRTQLKQRPPCPNTCHQASMSKKIPARFKAIEGRQYEHDGVRRPHTARSRARVPAAVRAAARASSSNPIPRPCWSRASATTRGQFGPPTAAAAADRHDRQRLSSAGRRRAFYDNGGRRLYV